MPLVISTSTTNQQDLLSDSSLLEAHGSQVSCVHRKPFAELPSILEPWCYDDPSEKRNSTQTYKSQAKLSEPSKLFMRELIWIQCFHCPNVTTCGKYPCACIMPERYLLSLLLCLRRLLVKTRLKQRKGAFPSQCSNPLVALAVSRAYRRFCTLASPRFCRS